MRRTAVLTLVAMIGMLPAAPTSANAVTYSLVDLGPASVSSTLVVINDSGKVAWTKNDRAFLFSAGVATDLGTLGGSMSAATAINAAGQVVGYAQTAGGHS